MKVLRSNRWEFVGEEKGLLIFKEIKFENSYVYVDRCKYVNVEQNKVYFMMATADLTEGDEQINYG